MTEKCLKNYLPKIEIEIDIRRLLIKKLAILAKMERKGWPFVILNETETKKIDMIKEMTANKNM